MPSVNLDTVIYKNLKLYGEDLHVFHLALVLMQESARSAKHWILLHLSWFWPQHRPPVCGWAAKGKLLVLVNVTLIMTQMWKKYTYIDQCSHLLQVTLVLFWLGWGVLGWNGDLHRWFAEAAVRRSYCVWCGSELATPVRLRWSWFSSWYGKESHCLWLTNSTRSSRRRCGNTAPSPIVGVR